MEYVPVLQGIETEAVKKDGETIRIKTTSGEFTGRAVILATGAAHRNLGVPGEERFSGRGVSYCSTCDGYIFKDGGRVVVVGGGSSALTDAIYLDGIGAKVTLVHRSDAFKAEQHLQDILAERRITTIMDAHVTAIEGKGKVERVLVKRQDTGTTETIEADGVFIAIGYKPNNDLARAMGLEIDAGGYIVTDAAGRTQMKGVYAAGDVTGGIKQITVAVAQGSVAAISAFEDLSGTNLRESRLK
jgi:thioredoxin reductase (NADPH)